MLFAFVILLTQIRFCLFERDFRTFLAANCTNDREFKREKQWATIPVAYDL